VQVLAQNLFYLCITGMLSIATWVAPHGVQWPLLLLVGVLGYLVFGNIPRPAVWIGASLILLSGFFMLWRERRSVFRED